MANRVARLKTTVILSHHKSDRTIERCTSSIMRNHPDEFIALLSGNEMFFSETEGINRAIEKASGDVIFITNSDCYLPDNWIKSHLKYYPQFNMVLGSPSYNIKSLSFRNFSARKEVLEKMGITDMFHQDTDLGLRLMLYGNGFRWKIADEIKVEHDDLKESPQKKALYAYHHMQLMKKYGVKIDLDDILHHINLSYIRGALNALTSKEQRGYER